MRLTKSLLYLNANKYVCFVSNGIEWNGWLLLYATNSINKSAPRKLIYIFREKW